MGRQATRHIEPQVKTTILICHKTDPARATSLVEYGDGRFGIASHGHPIGTPWETTALTDCVDAFWRLTHPAAAGTPASSGGQGDAAAAVPQVNGSPTQPFPMATGTGP